MSDPASAVRRHLFGGSFIASSDLALLRCADKIARRVLGERPQGLADDYISETYAMADESGVNPRTRYWLPLKSEMKDMKDMLMYLWLVAWIGIGVVALIPMLLLDPPIRLYVAFPFGALASVALTLAAIHGPIDGMSRKRIHGEVFVAHTLSNRVFAIIWLINYVWLYWLFGIA
jgi:hypothetical protein